LLLIRVGAKAIWVYLKGIRSFGSDAFLFDADIGRRTNVVEAKL